MSQVHNKSVSIAELTDQARYIFKVEKLSDFEAVKVKIKSRSDVKLNYLKVKILEVIKSDDQIISSDDEFSVQMPPLSGLQPFNESLPLLGQTISITDPSALYEKPPEGKSYYVRRLENSAGPNDKVALFFSSGYQKGLSVFLGSVGFGLADVSQESTLKKAIEIRVYFDAIRSQNIENLKAAFAKYPKALNDVDMTWGTPLHFAARYGKKDDIDFLVKSGGSLAIQNSTGNNVVHDLIVSRFTENLQYVISISNDVNAKNKAGQTSLDLAKELPDPKIRKLLESALNKKK